MNDKPSDHADEPSTCFTTTHWSVVIDAGGPSSSRSSKALETLCRSYWYPIYAFARRQGHDDDSAKDLTQGFFTLLIQEKSLGQVDREQGKFRRFLLESFRCYLEAERGKANAEKRGGGQVISSLDEADAARRYGDDLLEGEDPESLYERRWALTVLDHAKERLRQEYHRKGKTSLYELLMSSGIDRMELIGSGFEKQAAELSISASGFRTAVLAMQRRYAELLREEVAQTVTRTEDVEGEIRCLIRALKGR